MSTPLAERLRPNDLNDYIGQGHLVGAQGVLKPLIEKGIVPSMIFWGPPGTGKTTLANIIAKTSGRPFYVLSAINAGVASVREVIDKASKDKGLFTTKNPILFIDEIHRFSKSQQDSLLHAVEKGIVTLIGATTENPSFEVIPALMSRCQTYVLNAFDKNDLIQLINLAITKDDVLSSKKIKISEYEALLFHSGGDGRKLLNILELVIQASTEGNIDVKNDFVNQIIQTKTSRFDKGGEQHYDIISAFIKSIRGSDPNAAVYWLARLIEGGEDVKFIARRLVILAAEDIGLANPTALILANSTFQTVQVIGHPESRIILSECAIYLATSPKSNSAYMSINQAQELVKKTGDLSVPLHLRNAPTKLMKDLDYGKNYQYAHQFDNHFVKQEFLPEELSNTKLYAPNENVREQANKDFLKKRWENKYDY
jgi:putative ATPase